MNFISQYKYQIVAAILSIIIPLIFIVANNFYGLYGQDSYAYAAKANLIYNSIFSFDSLKDFHWPIGYSSILAISKTLLPEENSFQFANVVSLVVCTLLVFKLLSKNILQKNNLLGLIVLFLITSPWVLKLSVTVMAELPALALFLLSLASFQKYENNKRTKHLSFWITAFILTTLFRSAFVILFIPFGVFLLWNVIKSKLYSQLIMIFISAILFLLLFIAIPFLFGSGLQHPFIEKWSLLNLFKSEFVNVQANYVYKLPNIVYAFYSMVHPVFSIMVMVILLVLFVKRKLNWDKTNTLFLLSAMIYILFIAGLPEQNVRYFLPAYLLISLVLIRGVAETINDIKPKFRVVVFVFILISNLFFAQRIIYPVVELNKTEMEIVSELNGLDAETIITFEYSSMLSYYFDDIEIIDLWNKKVHYNKELLGRTFVVINEDALKNNWKNSEVFQNYKKLKSTQSFNLVKRLNQNTVIYEIK